MKRVSVDEFSDILEAKRSKLEQNLPKVIELCCERIRSTAINDMAKTQRNMGVSYGTKGHHPSLPGNAPAPDTGNLRSSIHYTVEDNGKKSVGYVGTDVEYGKHLEYGTSKMQPRPWLKPATLKNKDSVKKLLLKELKND